MKPEVKWKEPCGWQKITNKKRHINIGSLVALWREAVARFSHNTLPASTFRRSRNENTTRFISKLWEDTIIPVIRLQVAAIGRRPNKKKRRRLRTERRFRLNYAASDKKHSPRCKNKQIVCATLLSSFGAAPRCLYCASAYNRHGSFANS